MPDRSTTALILGLLLLLPGRAAVAQGAAEARARAERLLREYRAERVATERENLQNLRQRQSDTVSAGALRVVVRQADRALVQQATNAAWSQIEARYGRLSGEMARFPILIEPSDTTIGSFGAQARLRDGSITYQVAGIGRAGITAGLLRYADLLLWGSADSVLGAWYPATPEAGLDSSVVAERAYLELVTSLSVQAKSCMIGDDRACSEALGLREVPDPLIGAYDPAARRALVAGIATLVETWPLAAQYSACVEERDDAACVTLLRTVMSPSDSFSRYRLPPAVGDAARRALVAQMERLGGTDAWGRLVQAAGQPLETRFAVAAGVPPDSLMRVWRRGLFAVRPRSVEVTPFALLMAMAWCGLGLAFALRFSRWH
ncbi:MAG: hypothetical protein ABI742_05275 [Gemmatimonadota bacterium]